MVSALARAKEIQKEREERNANKDNTTWVNHFVELKQDESARLRFLYNLETPDHKNEMVCVMMHDYFVQANNRFVRAICAQEKGLPCHWCQVFEGEKAVAEAMPSRTEKEKQARRNALSNAYRKSAKEHFILPCLEYELDESGKPALDENRKFIVTSQLLDLKGSVMNSLIKDFEHGIEIDDDGNTEKDIRVCDYVYSRTGTGTDTKYATSPQRAKKMNLSSSTPTRERVMELIEECRPMRALDRNAIAANDTTSAPAADEEEAYASSF